MSFVWTGKLFEIDILSPIPFGQLLLKVNKKAFIFHLEKKVIFFPFFCVCANYLLFKGIMSGFRRGRDVIIQLGDVHYTMELDESVIITISIETFVQDVNVRILSGILVMNPIFEFCVDNIIQFQCG